MSTLQPHSWASTHACTLPSSLTLGSICSSWLGLCAIRVPLPLAPLAPPSQAPHSASPLLPDPLAFKSAHALLPLSLAPDSRASMLAPAVVGTALAKKRQAAPLLPDSFAPGAPLARLPLSPGSAASVLSPAAGGTALVNVRQAGGAPACLPAQEHRSQQAQGTPLVHQALGAAWGDLPQWRCTGSRIETRMRFLSGPALLAQPQALLPLLSPPLLSSLPSPLPHPPLQCWPTQHLLHTRHTHRRHRLAEYRSPQTLPRKLPPLPRQVPGMPGPLLQAATARLQRRGQGPGASKTRPQEAARLLVEAAPGCCKQAEKPNGTKNECKPGGRYCVKNTQCQWHAHSCK